MHLDEEDRGFSFRFDGPLDMRLDTTQGKTAADIINFYDEKALETIFFEYGEEPKSKIIVKAIILERKKKKIQTTKELAQIIETISFFPQTKARIFQAIRIEVNQELRYLEKSLQDAIKILKSRSDIFVISFHSLEDRIVKHFFKKEGSNCICQDIICTCKHVKQLEVISKKPILPTEEEMKNNSRSKSAKARHAKKL
jgi:16S rRNA (cytosine1402-N4)-methyltransferase